IDFFGKSLLKGGGLSFLGDIMSALSDPTGRSASDFISGPLLGQSMKLGMLLTGMGNNIIEGKESTRMMEVANTLKSNIPLQNLWYSKRSEEHTSELQSRENLVCRLLLE